MKRPCCDSPSIDLHGVCAPGVELVGDVVDPSVPLEVPIGSLVSLLEGQCVAVVRLAIVAMPGSGYSPVARFINHGEPGCAGPELLAAMVVRAEIRASQFVVHSLNRHPYDIEQSRAS